MLEQAMIKTGGSRPELVARGLREAHRRGLWDGRTLDGGEALALALRVLDLGRVEAAGAKPLDIAAAQRRRNAETQEEPAKARKPGRFLFERKNQ